MLAKAVEKAKIELDRAREAVRRIESGGLNFPGIESAWWTLLYAMGGVYAKLEQGAKGDNASEAWFGQKKHERRTDPLLSYLHHARNNEAHTLEGSTNQEEMSLKPINSRVKIRGKRIEVPADLKPGEPIGTLVPPYIRLLDVYDARSGKTYAVPAQHMGHDLAKNSPAAVSRTALTYLEGLVAEAEGLIL